MGENHNIWNIQLDRQEVLQRKNENCSGYINIYKKYVKEESYAKMIYYSLFAEEMNKQAKLFNSKRLNKNDLQKFLKSITINLYSELSTTLYNNGRVLEIKMTTSPLIKHLFAVAYKRISLNVGINYRNLQYGLPVVVCSDDKHYLLLPEDFGYSTKFFCNKESANYSRGVLMNYV